MVVLRGGGMVRWVCARDFRPKRLTCGTSPNDWIRPDRPVQWSFSKACYAVRRVQHETCMSKRVSFSYARQNFAEILTQAADSQEPVIISRRRHEDIALLPASVFRSLEETTHLMRSPANARRHWPLSTGPCGLGTLSRWMRCGKGD
jgi:prevent-host-death family protein